MQKTVKKIFYGLAISGLALIFAGCSEPVSSTYGYLVNRNASSIQVLIDKKHKNYVFTFHPDSNQEMLNAFNELKQGIKLPGADGKRIFLTGINDPKAESFILESWFITTPFYELVFEDGRSPYNRRRDRLKPSDFYSPIEINLNRIQRSSRMETAKKYGGAGNYKPEDFD